MATKSVTIKESAYEILKSRKHEDESFSDVIERIAQKRPLTDLLTIISEEDGKELANEISKIRGEMEDEIEERSKNVEETLE